MKRLHQMRESGERGAILVLTLGFLLLFGVFISALLSQTGVSFKNTEVVRDRAAKTYNADAGVDYGLMRVTQDQTLCPNAAVGPQSITAELPGGLVINSGVPAVQVTCQTVDGAAIGANGYAAIILSGDADALETKSGQSKVIEGAIFVQGGFKLGKPLEVKLGDVEKGPGSCAKPGNLVVTTPYAWVCQAATPALPAHVLPNYPSISRPKAGTLIPGGCTVFKPGVYGQAPDLGTKNYFTSGIYVFRDIGKWDIGKADLYGGAQAPLDSLSVTSGAPCTTDAGGGGAGNGTGVQFIFEGNSYLELENQSRVELFNRVSAGGPEGTAGITIFAVGPDAPSPPWKPFSAAQPVIGLKNGTTPEFAVHGMIYAPTAAVQLFATNTTVAQSLAGLVVDKLLLESSASANALSISGTKGKGSRVMVVTATAPGPSPGQVVVSSTAVLEIANQLPRKLRVISRRVE